MLNAGRKLGPWRLEPRPEPGRGLVFLVSLGAVLAALIVTGLIFWAYGHNPVTAYRDIFASTLGNARGAAEVLRKSIPLLLAGVGLVLAFPARRTSRGTCVPSRRGHHWTATASQWADRPPRHRGGPSNEPPRLAD